MKESDELLFECTTPLGFKVSITTGYWDYITTIKHTHIKGMESKVIITLKDPDLIRQSRVDQDVYLFYREIEYNNKNYHMCVVTNKSQGFIITA